MVHVLVSYFMTPGNTRVPGKKKHDFALINLWFGISEQNSRNRFHPGYPMDNTMPASVLNLASERAWLMSPRRLFWSGKILVLWYPIVFQVVTSWAYVFLGSSHTVDGSEILHHSTCMNPVNSGKFTISSNWWVRRIFGYHQQYLLTSSRCLEADREKTSLDMTTKKQPLSLGIRWLTETKRMGGNGSNGT